MALVNGCMKGVGHMSIKIVFNESHLYILKLLYVPCFQIYQLTVYINYKMYIIFRYISLTDSLKTSSSQLFSTCVMQSM